MKEQVIFIDRYTHNSVLKILVQTIKMKIGNQFHIIILDVNQIRNFVFLDQIVLIDPTLSFNQDWIQRFFPKTVKAKPISLGAYTALNADEIVDQIESML